MMLKTKTKGNEVCKPWLIDSYWDPDDVPPIYKKYQLSARCPSTYSRHTPDILNIRDTSQIQTLCPFLMLYIRDAYAYILSISVLLTMDNVPCTFSFLLLSKAKARSHCTYGCKEDAKRKKILPSVEKTLCIRCILNAYVFHTIYPSSVRPLWFHQRKGFLSCRPGPTGRWTQNVCKKDTADEQNFGGGSIRFHPLKNSATICESETE